MIDSITKLLFLYLPLQIALNPAPGVDLASIRIIIPLIFIFWLIDSLKNKKLILPNNLTFVLFISFLLICSFSLFFANNPNWGLRKLIFLLSIFPLFFVVYGRFSSNQAKTITLLKYCVWGALVASGIGIIQFLLQFVIPLDKLYSFWAVLIVPFLGNSFSEAVLTNPSWLVNVGGHTLMRATALFPDPHMFSFYLNMNALISLGIYFYHKKDLATKKEFLQILNVKASFYIISFLIIISTSFLTFSRGGYIGLIAGLTFFIFFILKNKIKLLFKNTINIFIISTLLIILSSTIFIPNYFSARLFSSFNLLEGSNSERLTNWNQSLKIIKENTFLGVGLGNYSLSIKPSATYREPFYSHNTLLDIAAETGIFNALIWISLFLAAIITFLKKFNLNNNFIYLGLASALVSFFIHSIFETAIFSIHILPLIILILALANFKKND